MEDTIRKKILRTAGYISIGVGFYLVYKGTDFELDFDSVHGDIIDAEFEVIEDD